MRKAIEYKLTAVKNSYFPSVKISTSRDSVEFIRKFYFDDILIYESFFILLLNRNNNTVGWMKVSQGGIAGTVADPKIIGKAIVDNLASHVILCHNHPSGNIRPSQADIDLTKKIKEMAVLLDSHVIDHIILTDESYLSFADEGLL